MDTPQHSYRAAFDDGVVWQAEGSWWSVSGWAFSAAAEPFALTIDVDGQRHALDRSEARPDVALAYGDNANAMLSGFSCRLALSPGTRVVRLIAAGEQDEVCLIERTLTVTPSLLKFSIDTPAGSVTEAGTCRIAGWCSHPEDQLYALFVSAGDQKVAARYGLARPDVARALAGVPEACGFEAYITLAPGSVEVTLEARLCSGATITVPAPRLLRVRGESPRDRIAALVGSVATIGQRASRWRRTRGRWPRRDEWPHLLRRARQEVARAVATRKPMNGQEAPLPLDRYEAWLAANEWNSAAAARLLERLEHCSQPLVSIVMPVYNGRRELLREAVASVLGQVSSSWELCIVDDCSSDPSFVEELQRLGQTDPRVRVQRRATNGNVSIATNDGVALAQGEFVVFLDQDDLLAPDCVAEVALAVTRERNVDVLYSDDDKIDGQGRRHSPQFKPQWSPELLLSMMYMGHVLAVRRSAYLRTGGMRIGFEGAQDHDFALRVTESARRIVHIPRVLYHWRDVPGSTARSGEAKPESFEAARHAIGEALARRGMAAHVTRPAWAQRTASGVFSHDFPDEGPAVTIVITVGSESSLRRCLHALAKTTYRDFDVVVVQGNAHPDDVPRIASPFAQRVVRGRAGTSLAATLNGIVHDEVTAEFVLFLDADVEVCEERWLSRMIGYACLPGVSVVGARLISPAGKVRQAGMTLGLCDGLVGAAFEGLDEDDPGYLGFAKVARDVAAIDGACMLTPRATFLRHGGFDAAMYGDAFADVDYCLRLVQAGFRCVYAAGAEMRQHSPARKFDAENPRHVAVFRNAYYGMADPWRSAHMAPNDPCFRVQPTRIETARPRSIRALMCCFNLNWEGAPYSQFEMTRALARRGVLVPIVFSPLDGPLRRAYEEAGIEVHVREHPLANCVTAAEYEAAIELFAAWVSSLGVSLVYGNTLQTFYAIDAAHRLRLGSIWNPRESEPWREYFRGFGPHLESAALRCFQYPYRVIFVAHATARVYRDLDSHHNFCVIHNGLDPSVIERAKGTVDRNTARSDIGSAANDVIILLLGTVCERKGQLDALAGWSLLPENVRSTARLYIVGDRPGPYSSALHARLAQLPPDARTRVTVVPETDAVATYFAAADVFLCTSLVESYPRVVLEAMAWELPIVTTPVFGIAEQVRAGLNALVYEPGDAGMLAEQLARIVVDPELRSRMAKASCDVLATLNDFEQMIDAYMTLFEQASLVTAAPVAGRPSCAVPANHESVGLNAPAGA